jgi:3-oxoacyl-[acyl-carrier-protein] synthase-3
MLHVLGAGYAHPATAIDNAFLESLDTGTSAEWIAKHIGIDVRRSVLPLDYIRETRNGDPRMALKVASETPTEMGVRAARMALERTGVRGEDVGLVIANNCTPLETTPAEAQRIAKALDLGCRAYDVFTACPAFALHLDLLASMREDRLPRYALCVSTAALTLTVDYRDRTDGAIWGDGAAAWLVSAEDARGLRVLDTSYETDAKRCEAVVVDRHGYFHQDGRAVRMFSVAQTVRMLRELEKQHAIDWAKTYFIGHQANWVMLEQICRQREIAAERHLSNVREVGNQAGAGAPAALALHWDRVQPGERVAVAVVGAGLSWGSAILERV